jgi:hypothetical protein
MYIRRNSANPWVFFSSIHTQVLIAPNESAVKKIPPAPGLLLYQPSKKELFIKGNNRWNKIAMQKEVSKCS